MKRRNTPQQKAVLETIRKFRTHPTADELYAEIQKSYPSIGRATVYRNLSKLCEEGLIRKITIPNGADRFDNICKEHYHGKCISCGKLFNIKASGKLDMRDFTEQSSDFFIVGQDVTIRGYCRDCMKARKS